MVYYLAKIKFLEEDDNGRVKKRTRKYIVKAVSIGDAEVIIHKEMRAIAANDFEISGISEFEITDIISAEEKDSNADIKMYE